MWVKTCLQTKHIDRLTDDTWSTRMLKTKMVFLLILYWCHFYISWPAAEGCTLTHLHVHYIWKLTQSSYGTILATSFSPQSHKGPAFKTVWTTSFLFTRPQSSISHFPSATSSLSAHLSFLNSLQEPAKLHCHVTLTSQLKWHIGYNFTTLKFQHYDNSLN